MHPHVGPEPKIVLTPGLLACTAVLAISIIDTLNAIRRRSKARVAFSVADRRHIHHILLDLGFSVRQVLAIAWGTTAVMSASAITAFTVSRSVGAVLMVSVLALLLAFWALAYKAHQARALARRVAGAARASIRTVSRAVSKVR